MKAKGEDMVVTQSAPRSSGPARPDDSGVTRPRRSRPITWWALLGAAFLAMQAYVMGAWILTDATPTPTGPTPLSTWDAAWGYIWQIGGCIALVGFWYWFIVKPIRETRTIPLDGLLVVCYTLIVWQDPWCNYVKPWGAYNTHLIQWGSWVEHLPGWMSPRGHYFAEPLLVMIPVYVWGVLGFTMIGCAVMRAFKRRFPSTGTAGMIAVCYGFFLVTDVVLETLWMRTGIWAYPGGGTMLTFWEGTRYQFPIKEMFLWGGAWAAFTCLRYFRNDRGQTFAERGGDQLKAGPWRKTGIQFLALYGAINLLYILCYNLPINMLNMHDTTWSQGVQEISYMNDALCGQGTDYACPTADTPIPWNGSAHLRPDGTWAPPVR